MLGVLTDHVFSDMRHGVELLLTDFTGEFLLCVAMHNLVVLMEGPELFEDLTTCHTLKYNHKKQAIIVLFRSWVWC